MQQQWDDDNESQNNARFYMKKLKLAANTYHKMLKNN